MLLGTIGKRNGIEALRIKLNNDDNYTIKYRAYVRNVGWQNWKYDGEMAGTTGQSKPIEAIEIILMPKVYRATIGFDNVSQTIYDEECHLTGFYLANVPNPTLEAYIDNRPVNNLMTLSANNNIYNEQEGYGDKTNTSKPMYDIFLTEEYVYALKSGNHLFKLVVKNNGATILSKEYTLKVDIDNLHIRYTSDSFNQPISQIDDSALEATQIANLKVELLNNKENIKLESLAYFKNLGWQSQWVSNNSPMVAGDRQIQAVRFKLNSDKYSIQYKVKINGAWQDYAYDGEYAGMINQGYTISAIRIKIVPKIVELKGKVFIDFPKGRLSRKTYDFTGWGVSNDPSATLKLYMDNKLIEVNRVDRQDVLDAIKGYRGDFITPYPGYKASVNLSNAKIGKHSLKLQYVSGDGKILDTITSEFQVANVVTTEKGIYGKSGLKVKKQGGYDLEYFRYGDGPNVAFFTFEVHGFEDHWDRDGTELVLTAQKFYEKLCSIKDFSIADKWTIFIFPECNPDGRKNGYTNNGPGRTTLYSIYGDVGVDMNRCWSTGFEPRTNARNYTGQFSFGAYEAQYLKDFLLSHKSTTGQTILVDCHGWLSQLIGDTDMMGYYHNQFSDSKLTYTYGKGYLISWARANLGTNGRTAKSLLVELPSSVSNPSDFVNQNVANRFINASLDMLKGLN